MLFVYWAVVLDGECIIRFNPCFPERDTELDLVGIVNKMKAGSRKTLPL
jgi:hypothetical protein